MLFDLSGKQINADSDNLKFNAITPEIENEMSAFVLGCVLTWVKVKLGAGLEEDFSVRELLSGRNWEATPLQAFFNNPAYANMTKEKKRENVQIDAGKLLKKVLINYDHEFFEYCKRKGDDDNHWSNTYRIKKQKQE